MAKFNSPMTAKARGTGPIASEQTPSTTTYEGAPAYLRDAKSELFLLAVANMVGEDTFYEKASDRDSRYTALIAKVAVEDFDWLFRMLVWLRSEGNMRSAPIVGAVEAVRARLAYAAANSVQAAQLSIRDAESRAAGRTNRALISAVCQRADEPGEILAYHFGTHGKAVPMPIKRGVGDAAVRLYNERSLLKYDSSKAGIRFGDVIEISHAKTSADWQNILFRYAMDKHGRNEIPEILGMVSNRARLMKAADTYEKRMKFLALPDSIAALGKAGITWEALSGWLQGSMTAQVWESVIPSMGYMALIRNLRNFDEVGVSDAVAQKVAEKIADPVEVAKSRQFPFRFWSSYKAVSSTRWLWALDQALTHCLSNLPDELDKTLVLIDTSASMTGCTFSKKGTVTAAQAAAIFGVALGTRRGIDADVFGFATGVFGNPMPKGASVLREIEKFERRTGEVGHGTDIPLAIQRTLRTDHKRLVIITDGQTMGGGTGWGQTHKSVSDMVPAHVPIYGFNLNGYNHSMMPSKPNRIELGGMTDSTFKMIPLIEAGSHANWPF